MQPRLAPLAATLALGISGPTALGQGTPIGFEEQFALATDREAVLAKLIPGTEDYYYYHCLHAQNEGRLAEVPALLKTWTERYGRTQRVDQIEVRQALLDYERDPAATYEYLRSRLSLGFQHRREVPGQVPDLPTALDSQHISLGMFVRQALARHPNTVDGFRDSAFELLLAADLDAAQTRSLLARLQRPDLPGLSARVVRELERRNSRGFGSFPIHSRLLLDQLDECLRLRPSLLSDANFVRTYLQRLAPDADTNWRTDTEAREAYLNRLEGFVQRLAPAFNSWKANVLYHRLLHDHRRGVHDRARFLEYLRLPRSSHFVEAELNRRARPGEIADLSADPGSGLGAIGDDEPLVRAYLQHFFRTEDSFEPYRPFVQNRYLERLFAETKILHGIGEMERWYSLLDDPGYYEQLEQRVELEFAADLPHAWPTDEPVVLELDVKNVQNLIVKVFEIDAFNFARDHGRDVDASIDLDGLVANHEETHRYDEVPLRRVRRSFRFPQIQGTGTWVVDFIGNGLSSRAVIQRGTLSYRERVGAAGHVLQVLDQTGRVVEDASVWIEGLHVDADDNGLVRVPFSTEPGQKTMLLRHGPLCVATHFHHRAESYTLHAGIHVSREALLGEQQADVIIRPSLLVQGAPASLKALEQPLLRITSVDLAGNPSRLEVRDLELENDREIVHRIDVPRDLRSLTVEFHAEVENLSTGQTDELAAPARTFPVNEIDATAELSTPLLGRNAKGWVLDVLGKNGEPKADRDLTLRFEHRHCTDPIHVALKTDADGRIELGELTGIVRVQVAGQEQRCSWWLDEGGRSLPASLHGTADAPLRLALPDPRAECTREYLSLLELRGGAFYRDCFAHLSVEHGILTLRDLSPGDYDLWLKDVDRHASVRVVGGEQDGGWARSGARELQLSDRTPLQITALETRGDTIDLELSGHRPSTRVHVYATRYRTPFDAYAHFRAFGELDPRRQPLSAAESLYASGREIGDEYRYILERRYAKKFPGNMLARPSLLLHPWALTETTAEIGVGGGAGGGFGGRYGRRGGEKAAAGADPAAERGSPAGTFANLDFLATPAVVLANLRPDADGRLRIPRAELGSGSMLHVVVADFGSTLVETRALSEVPLERRDRSLTDALPAESHFTERRGIEFVDRGQQVVLENLMTSQIESFDTLASVHALFSSLSSNTDLNRFSFLLEWPALTHEEKLAKYSEFGCHELHFFLHEKDPAFFEEVVRPYLAQKMDKTFLDHWLLGHDLRRFLDPWHFDRLNVVERILLARHLRQHHGSVARHLRESFELQPPQTGRELALFERVMRGSSLDRSRSLGDELQRERGRRMEESRKRAFQAADGPAGPPAPTAGAPARAELAGEAVEEEKLEELDAFAELEDLALDADIELREQSKALFRAPDPTRALVEHNYWHLRIERQNGGLVPVNAFWVDFAEAPADAPFFSSHLGEPTANFTEMMFALSVLDLPFTAEEHETEVEGPRFTLTAASPLLLVRKELGPADVDPDAAPILVQQNFFRPDDRYRFEGNRRYDKYVQGEFLLDIVYGCQVVVTNPTSTPRQLELLMQIPAGAMPVQSGFFTKSLPAELGAYSTTTHEYFFYFPSTGERHQFPLHVSEDGVLIAHADSPQLRVVREPTQVDTTSWQHLSQNGTEGEVLEALQRENLRRLPLDKIAWRMHSQPFFRKVTDFLRQHHVYADTLWSYSLRHGDERTAREYLAHQGAVTGRCGTAFESKLVRIDPVARHRYQHLEFDPLINERAHRFGKQRTILDHTFATQYQSFLDVASHRPRLDDEDWMTATYYLVLQDRVEEALAAFGRVDRSRLPTQVQYDYLRAYLAFYGDELEEARALASRYAEHPVERWRERFAEVGQQLDEAMGIESLASVDSEDRTRQLTALADSEPSLELEVEGGEVVLRHQNLDTVEIRYYEMDVEFLFSGSPFVQQDSGSFAYVRPNRADSMPLDEAKGETSFGLPSEFHGRNLLVEARGGGRVRRQTYLANTMHVRTLENYGQVQVTDADEGKPLSKAYVKVYARAADGSVRFHKDGYTDLRGRFDYVSLTGPSRTAADRYSLLILSETDGAALREVAAPLQ